MITEVISRSDENSTVTNGDGTYGKSCTTIITIILVFLLLRAYFGICSVPPPVHIPFLHYSQCSIMDKIVDSFAAYFQFPRSSTNIYDTIERIVSIPILGTAFIAIRRKFERIK
jgi:hypothetical protein